MAKYIGHILAKTHPSIWDDVGWNLIIEANQKNRPPIDEEELRNTFESIKNKEQRSGTDRWYKKIEGEDVNLWKEEDNRILPISEIAAKDENADSERYKTKI